MIQRIQTLYLFLIMLLSIIMFFSPVAGLQNIETTTIYELSYRGLYELNASGKTFMVNTWMLTAIMAIIPLLSSFKALKINHEREYYTKIIREQLIKLDRDFNIFGKEWDKLNRSIDTVKKDSDKENTRVERISNKFDSIKKVKLPDDKEVIEISDDEDQ